MFATITCWRIAIRIASHSLCLFLFANQRAENHFINLFKHSTMKNYDDDVDWRIFTVSGNRLDIFFDGSDYTLYRQ